MGLNGVDNGQIWFDHVKVPRDALLDKYASVSAEGVYSSSIKSVAQRFGVTVGGLTTGTHPDLLHRSSVARARGARVRSSVWRLKQNSHMSIRRSGCHPWTSLTTLFGSCITAAAQAKCACKSCPGHAHEFWEGTQAGWGQHSYQAFDCAAPVSPKWMPVSSQQYDLPLPAGRLLIAQGAVDACKVGTAIAIRYSCKRPQFGEKMIMEYITQQRRLLPGLATTYAMQVSMMRLRVGHCAAQLSIAVLSTCRRCLDDGCRTQGCRDAAVHATASTNSAGSTSSNCPAEKLVCRTPMNAEVLNRNLNVPCFCCQAVCLCMPIRFDACTTLAPVEHIAVGSLVSAQYVSAMSTRKTPSIEGDCMAHLCAKGA